VPAAKAIAKLRTMAQRAADMRPMWTAEEKIMRGIINARMPRLKRTKQGEAALVSLPSRVKYRVTKAALVMRFPFWTEFHTNGTVHLPVRNPFPFALKDGDRTEEKVYSAGVARRITRWIDKGELA
jgi:hypothetical protein